MAKRRKRTKKPAALAALFLSAALACGALYGALSPAGSAGGGASPASSPALGSAEDLPEGGLKMHVIDVGQGDSILLEADGYTVLIDGGPGSGAPLLLDYLEKRGVETIDLVVATHPHEDHIGGLDDVIGAYGAEQVLMPKKQSDTRAFEKLLDAIDERGMTITPAEAGWEASFGGLRLLAYSPEAGADYDNTNDWSVTLSAEYEGRTALLMGDAETTLEARILDSLPQNVDVLKVGHHGSRTSSSTALLDHVSPDSAVICCAAGNSYGHPHEEVLDRFDRRGIPLYRTDTRGSLVFTFTAEGVWMEAEREEETA